MPRLPWLCLLLPLLAFMLPNLDDFLQDRLPRNGRSANLLVMPNLDAGNIAYQLIKIIGDALPVGPILIGPARPAHILTPSVTARGIVNMTAVAAAEAMEGGSRQQRLHFG